MRNSSDSRKQSRMVAGRDDPWISVSLLAEHSYCPRAGIIQYEANQEDTGDEEAFHIGRGRMTNPFYDLAQFQRAIERLKKAMRWKGIVCLIAFIVLCVFSLVTGLVPATSDTLASVVISSFGTLAFFGFWLLINIGVWLDLWIAYNRAKRSQGFVPDPYHTEPQDVIWWHLINGGFQPIRPQEQYRDVQWHLAGCPWRILVKGDLRIPVFRRRPSKTTGENKLHRNHYARMAAYCHLLEKCENARSPYGIVLVKGTYQGKTVPYQPGSKKTFHDDLLSTRQTLSILNRFIPYPPQNLQRCVQCPHSWRDWQTGQSECGIRFNWMPPNFKDYGY